MLDYVDNTKRSTMKLPKSYLSYSALKLWLDNPDQYRAKYYHDAPAFSTIQTQFGNKIGKMLEEGDVSDHVLARVPRYSHPEYCFEVDIEGVPIKGFIDSFDPTEAKFLEYKTGHRNKKGEAPWDRVKVRKHLQLPFYSLAIETQLGKVHDVCHLVWMETKFNEVTTRKGLTPVADLCLTGDIQTFERVIEKWERERMKDLIVSTAEAISKDYEKYR